MPFPTSFPADHYKNPKGTNFSDSPSGELLLTRLINQQPGIFAQEGGGGDSSEAREKKTIILNGFVPRGFYYLELLLDDDFDVYQVNDEGELQSIKDLHNLAANPIKVSTEQLNKLLAKERLAPEEVLVLEPRHIDLYGEMNSNSQKTLDIHDSSISASEFIKLIASKPDLEMISLEGVTIFDNLQTSEIPILNLPKLKKLIAFDESSIFPCRIVAPSLEFLSISESEGFLSAIQSNNFENLNILDIKQPVIDGSVLASLCSPSLRILNLSDTEIKGKFNLTKTLLNLKRIRVISESTLNQENCALLMKMAPNVIHFDQLGLLIGFDIYSTKIRYIDCLEPKALNIPLPELRRLRIISPKALPNLSLHKKLESLSMHCQGLSDTRIDEILKIFKTPKMLFDIEISGGMPSTPDDKSKISFKKLTKHSTPKLILKNMTEDEIWKFINACPAQTNVELENINFTQSGKTLAQSLPGKKFKLRFGAESIALLNGDDFLSWQKVEIDWGRLPLNKPIEFRFPQGQVLITAISEYQSRIDPIIHLIGIGQVPASMLNLLTKEIFNQIPVNPSLYLSNCRLEGELDIAPSIKFDFLAFNDDTTLTSLNFERLLACVGSSTYLQLNKFELTTPLSPGFKATCNSLTTDPASWSQKWSTVIEPTEIKFDKDTPFATNFQPCNSVTTLVLKVPSSDSKLRAIERGFPNLKKLSLESGSTLSATSEPLAGDSSNFNSVESLVLKLDGFAQLGSFIISNLGRFPNLKFLEFNVSKGETVDPNIQKIIDMQSRMHIRRAKVPQLVPQIHLGLIEQIVKYTPKNCTIIFPENTKVVLIENRTVVNDPDTVDAYLLAHPQICFGSPENKKMRQPSPEKKQLNRPNPADPLISDPNKTQTMLIHRLKAYARFVPPDYDIQKIQKGICSATAKYYADTVSINKPSVWKKKWERIRQWDRQSLPAEGQPLRQNLIELSDYVARYQISNWFYKIWDYFFTSEAIVNDLNLFLVKPFTHPVMISNAWHRTSLLFKNGKWHFFDPNYEDGEAKIFDKKEELIKEIHTVLGHGLKLTSYDENLDEVWNANQNSVNQFLAGGGFKELLQNNSRLEELEPNKLSKEALEGLFLGDLNHNPFWIDGLIEHWYTPFTAGNRQPTTLACFASYQMLVGQSVFEQKLIQSLAYANKEKRKELKSSLPDSGPYKKLAATLLACLKKAPLLKAKDDEVIWSRLEREKPQEKKIPLKPEKVIAANPTDTSPSGVSAEPMDSADNPADEPWELEVSKELKSQPLEKKTATLPEASPFLTWTKQKPQAFSSLEEFDATLLQEEGKNRLVRFTDDEKLKNYIHHLQASPKARARGLFVINSYSDLQCAASSLLVDKQGKGQLQPAFSGYFYKFLKSNEDNSPIIVVNWANFSSEEVVLFLNLIAKKRMANGVSLPKKALVLGLQNPKAADAYLERDFYQSSEIKKFPKNIQIPKIEPAPAKLSANTAEVCLEFYNDHNWEGFFYGKFELSSEGMIFKPSTLIEALEAKPESLKIVFRNAPWHLSEFNYAWSSFLSTGMLNKYGLSFNLPANLVLENQSGYDFKPSISKTQLSVCEGNINDNEDYILNPDQLSTFFVQYRVDKATRSMQTLPGLIAAHPKQKPMRICLTRAISLAAFARLLDEAAEKQVVLQLKLVGNVKLPKEIASLLKVQKDESLAATGKLRLVVSNDPFCTEKTLKFDQVVDISESDKTDLLYRISGKIEDSNLRFDKLPAGVWQALKKGKRVLLKGSFSEELVDALAGFFTPKDGIYHNGKFKSPEGELILLTDNPKNFGFAPQVHFKTETFETRSAFLSPTDKERLLAKYGKEQLENCPLAHLQILSKKQPLPDKLDSLTKPLYRLPKRAEQIDQDYDLNLDKAERFERQRVEALLEGLKQCPILFLSGKTGVGKSSFMHELKKYGIEVYFNDIEGWLKAPAGQLKILFIDEANLEAEDRTLFTTLLSNPKSINYKGKITPLTDEDMVVLAGNPANYGHRHVPAVLLNFPNVVTFGAMNNAYLYHRVIKPILKDTENSEAIARIFLKSFQKIKQKRDEAISARELQMMAYVFQTQAHPLHPIERAKYSAMQICKNLLNGTEATDFQAWFKAEFGGTAMDYPTPPRSIGKNKKMRLVPSHSEAYWRLKTMIAIRDFKCQTASFGGLSSLVFEGEPKSGKTSLVKQFLYEEGFSEINLDDAELLKPVDYSTLRKQLGQNSGKNYYYLPADLSVAEKSNLLFRAFHEGAIVVMKDTNSVKRLLNALRMGEDLQGRRALVAGFTLIETQTPATLSKGRAKTGLDSERRSWKCQLPSPNRDEMLAILTHKGCSLQESEKLVDELIFCQEYAIANKLSPLPNFGDLMAEERKLRLIGNPNTFYAKEKCALQAEEIGTNEDRLVSSVIN